MSRAALSAGVFAAYLLVVGLTLWIAPNVLLSLFGMPAATEVWVRVLGVIVTLLGGYYVAAARTNDRAFFRATVWGRPFVFFGFLSLVVSGLAAPTLLLFPVVDVLGAVWTAWALGADRVRPAA